MGRTTNLSPMGLYNWDSTIFDLLVIPEALDRDTLINNLLLETAELEVLYTSPVTFRYAVGQWSKKELDIWERLYATTQYEYDPIENYNRYEDGSDGSTVETKHTGTDTTTDGIMHGGTDTKAVNTTQGGSDATARNGTANVADGGTEGETGNYQIANGGNDTVTGSEEKGHWVAGFDAPAPTAQNDGLVKQTRDESDSSVTTAYGKTESGNNGKTTTFGKTQATMTTDNETTNYGKSETVQEAITHGETISRTVGLAHGENVKTTNDGEHELHAHGNIGVTTTQELIKEQRQIERFNIYDFIIEDFKMRFCVLVY